MARVEWITVVADPERWRAMGLVVDDEGFVPLVGTSLRIVAPGAAGPDVAGDVAGAADSGIVAWALSGVAPADESDPEPYRIDGLRTDLVDPLTPRFAAHRSGAIGLDHLVVTTDDLERTAGAIATATGCELKRVREVGPIRQGFHRIGGGGLIVEIVEHADAPPGPATFWGVVLNVEDLDGVCDRLGPELIGAAKDAVQPGRRIATVRRDAELTTAVALMTP